MSAVEYGRLADRLNEEIPTLYSFDLVNLDETGELMRNEILNKGKKV